MVQVCCCFVWKRGTIETELNETLQAICSILFKAVPLKSFISSCDLLPLQSINLSLSFSSCHLSVLLPLSLSTFCWSLTFSFHFLLISCSSFHFLLLSCSSFHFLLLSCSLPSNSQCSPALSHLRRRLQKERSSRRVSCRSVVTFLFCKRTDRLLHLVTQYHWSQLTESLLPCHCRLYLQCLSSVLSCLSVLILQVASASSTSHKHGSFFVSA